MEKASTVAIQCLILLLIQIELKQGLKLCWQRQNNFNSIALKALMSNKMKY